VKEGLNWCRLTNTVVVFVRETNVYFHCQSNLDDFKNSEKHMAVAVVVSVNSIAASVMTEDE